MREAAEQAGNPRHRRHRRGRARRGPDALHRRRSRRRHRPRGRHRRSTRSKAHPDRQGHSHYALTASPWVLRWIDAARPRVNMRNWRIEPRLPPPVSVTARHSRPPNAGSARWPRQRDARRPTSPSASSEAPANSGHDRRVARTTGCAIRLITRTGTSAGDESTAPSPRSPGHRHVHGRRAARPEGVTGPAAPEMHGRTDLWQAAVSARRRNASQLREKRPGITNLDRVYTDATTWSPRT